MTQPLVAAVIVTFNRLDKLQKSIAAVMGQSVPPDALFIVDNNSSDGTGAYIAELMRRYPQVRAVRLSENLGGAGGFYHGLLESYQANCDFSWILDDDCYPEPDCLEELLKGVAAAREKGINPSFACSRVLWTNGDICEMNNPVTLWNWAAIYREQSPLILVESCSFVSVLFPRQTIEAVGLPIKDYFIWHDDTEYTRRCSALSPGIQNLRSIAIHDLAVNRGVNFGDITPDNLWKFTYGARNVASYTASKSGLVESLRYFARTRNTMRRAGVPFSLRFSIYRKIFEGIFLFRPHVHRVMNPKQAPIPGHPA